MSIANDSRFSSDVPVLKVVHENSPAKTINITLINDETKKVECAVIIGLNMPLYDMHLYFLELHRFNIHLQRSLRYIYNGEDITNKKDHPVISFGMKDGDNIYVKGLPSVVSINFVDEDGEVITLKAQSNVEVWRVLKGYSARKNMHSALSQLLYFRWYYNGILLWVDDTRPLTELEITSGAVIYFKVVCPTEEDLGMNIRHYLETMASDWFIGQTVPSLDDCSFGRIRSCSDHSNRNRREWTVEFYRQETPRITISDDDLNTRLLNLYGINSGVLHDFKNYILVRFSKHKKDVMCLKNEISELAADVTKKIASKTKKDILLKLLKIEQEIEELNRLTQKIRRCSYFKGDDGQSPLDTIYGELVKWSYHKENDVKKVLINNNMYTITSKPTPEVGDSVYALHSGNKSWEAGDITSFSEDKDVDGYGPSRVYSILFDSGKEVDDIQDNEVICYDEYHNRMRKDWKGVKHVCDKDSSDSWARNIGWYTVNVLGIEEPFAYISDALRVYDAYTVCCKKGDLKESDLNYPEDWDGFFTLTSQEEYTSHIITFVESQWLSIRLMIAQERLATPILDPIFRVLKNCILPSSDRSMITSWLSSERSKADLGWRWKYALSDCMDIDDASVGSRDYSRFLEFALCLQSVDLATSIHQICRFFIGEKGKLSNFLSKVPTFGAAYAISIDSKVAPDSMTKYLQTNKPDHVNDFMFIRCRENDMLRRVVVLCAAPLKRFLTNYAFDKRTSIKSLRIKHNGKTLFISSIGQKTPLDLGIKEDDILDITIISTPSEPPTSQQPKQPSPKGKNTKKKKHKKSKKKRAQQPIVIQKTEAELRGEHSKLLGKVYEEAEPTFKEIRQCLNAMNLERTKPKQRTSPSKSQSAVEVVDNPLVDDSQLDGKAGKTQFIIQVGEVSNLYKTTKHSSAGSGRRQDDIMIDLHGLTAEEAVYRLNKHLPSWIETAMKGTYPFVIPVKIVCGGGSQILAEVVENWIKQNDHVANAPKNMYS